VEVAVSPLGVNGSGQTAAALTRREWSGATILGLVHKLNERSIETFQRLARTSRADQAPDLVVSLRNLWRSLDVAARQRAACCPFLLLDVHFQSETWWRLCQHSRPPRSREAVRPRGLPAHSGATLMRECLVLAWHTARLDPRASGLLLGVSPAVASFIAAMDLQDIERLAAHQHGHLRPRWEDRPYFWRQLLLAARKRDDDTLRELHLHGLQLAGGELIPNRVRFDTHSSVRDA
jgi:hypothetical protein